jgi:hypothetical protein
MRYDCHAPGCGSSLVLQLCQAAESTLDDIAKVVDSRACLEVLTPLVRSSQPPMLQLCIRLSARICKRMEPAALMELHSITSVLVVDEQGALVGALNSNDLMRAKVI